MVSLVPNYLSSLVFILFNLLLYSNGLEEDMTISIEPGSEECFYQPLMKLGEVLEVEYQVVDGGQGDLDISFSLTAPGGRILISDYKKSDNSHRYEVADIGDYRLCFDNRFSTFNSKTVFFEIVVESEDDDQDSWGGLKVEMANEEEYQITIEDIESAVNRVRTHLTQIRHMQELVRAVEARDRNTAEGNYLRVNYWSMIQIVVMLVVGIIQVVMVRSLFDEQSKVHKLWKTGFSNFR